MSSMSEWQKAVLSALAGVCVGILLEPIRFWIVGWLKRRQIRNLLYRDVAKICACVEYVRTFAASALERGEDRCSRQMVFYISQVSLDIYDHVLNAERTAFYQLEEAPVFDAFYGRLKDSILPVRQNDSVQRLIDYCDMALGSLHDAVTMEDIDRDLLEKRKRRYAKNQKERSRRYAEYCQTKIKRLEERRAEVQSETNAGAPSDNAL
jgi:hypothetical protein